MVKATIVVEVAVEVEAAVVEAAVEVGATM